ncbi:MAG TPA: DUF3617 family protein [Candidatus Acidoferrales bacterium]|nr:DUF3617 family protein [Candidatus Acidoferrales bacterium]
MRKAIAVAVICLGASLAFAATGSLQPLKVKTGQWQMTQTVTWTGLPPQYAAALTNGVPTHYKSCVKQSDLLKNPWANGSGADNKCSWTVLNSTGTDMEIQGTCPPSNSNPMTMQMHGKIKAIDSENGKGWVDATLSGNGMTAKGHATYTGKWIGATCSADVNN